MGDGAVQAIEVALCIAPAIGEINRWRLQAFCQWTVTCAVSAVTTGAVLAVKLCSPHQVGRLARYHRDLVAVDNGPAHLRGQGAYFAGVGFVDHAFRQPAACLDQPVPHCPLWQICDLLDDALGKVLHFPEFTGILHLSVADCLGIVDADVINELKKLLEISRM